ncbi:MAG: hypothetical protein M0Z60_04615, partial [Nitrospiraceae bacterium]|nr:hypothetical protein [Nitrospiraceae bacterium]
LILLVRAILGNVSWTWLLVPILVALFVVFTASLSTGLAILNVYVRDMAHPDHEAQAEDVEDVLSSLGIAEGEGPIRLEAWNKIDLLDSAPRIERDDQGRPVGGMVVFAYPTAVIFGRPLFVSEMSDRDGKFALRVAGGGKYYLAARAGYGGGPPDPDEMIGVYNYGSPITVGTKEVKKGMDMLVRKYLDWFQEEE